MRLPNIHTCPTCDSEFQKKMSDVAKEEFRCPICDSEMLSLKEEYRRWLFSTDIDWLLIEILDEWQGDFFEEEQAELMSRNTLTVDEVIEFLQTKNIGSSMSSSSKPLERIVQEKFLEVFGSEMIDINRYA